MAGRTRNPRIDLNVLAKSIVDRATGEAGREPEPPNPARRGRAGGLTGGKVRAARLSKAKRSEIARKAAAARWGSR